MLRRRQHAGETAWQHGRGTEMHKRGLKKPNKGRLKAAAGLAILGAITGVALKTAGYDGSCQRRNEFKYFSELSQEEKEVISSRVYLIMENDTDPDDPEFLYLSELHDDSTIAGIVDSGSDRQYINMLPGKYHIYSKKLENVEDQPVIDIDDADKDYSVTIDYETGEITVSVLD